MLVEGRYRVLDRIGRGGMGSVYRAEDGKLGRQVALKVVRDDTSEDPDLHRRFEREIQATAAIDHPHVVTVFDTGVLPDASLFYTMELLEGESLATVLRREGRLPWPRVRDITLQVCRGLAAAHARGIIHRDLKPDNIMLTRRDDTSDFVKVIDFGVARILRDGVGHGLTTTGRIVGTVAYMAPEQIHGGGDQRIDIYTLGVIVYQCLAGLRPYIGETDLAVLDAILRKHPRPLEELVDDLPRGPAQVIARAMARDPHDRPETMQMLAQEIRGCDGDLLDDSHERTLVRPDRLPADLAQFQPSGRRTAPLARQSDAQPAVEDMRKGHGEPSPPEVHEGGDARTSARPWSPSWLRTYSPFAALGITLAVVLATVQGSQPRDHNDAPSALPAASALSTTKAPQAAEAPAPLAESTKATAADAQVPGSPPAEARAIPPEPSAAPPPPPDPALGDSAVTTRPASARRPTLAEALSSFARRAGDKCRSALVARVEVEVKIEDSGRLAARSVLPPHDLTSTADCILGLLDRQKFPPTRGGAGTTITVHPRP